ncbi:MAG: hypothetical protein PHF37_10685, partial [Phycisphaerae bacterium]|nr:hypothetical protein [Phycisphaerae bacterium]
RDIYGASAAAGVAKLLTPGPAGLQDVITRAAGPVGMKAEQSDEVKRRDTLEARSAVSQAMIRQIELDLTEEQKYAMELRRIGEAEKKRFDRTEPLLSKRRAYYWPLDRLGQADKIKEIEAFRLWWERTEGSDRRKALGVTPEGPPLEEYIGKAYWFTRLSQQQRFDLLNSGVTVLDHSVNYYPVVDNSGIGGPRVGRDLP